MSTNLSVSPSYSCPRCGSSVGTDGRRFRCMRMRCAYGIASEVGEAEIRAAIGARAAGKEQRINGNAQGA